MRRRLFNVFAFACLAFAIYLIVFVKEERNSPQSSQTARTTTGERSAIEN
jgi:CHASE3 domain sensor protein